MNLSGVGLSAGAVKCGVDPSAAIAAGASFVELGTITREPREGNGSTWLQVGDDTLHNKMGMPNFGIDAFVEDLASTIELLDAPVIVSIAGGSESLGYCIGELRDLDVVLSLNVSCPSGCLWNMPKSFPGLVKVGPDTDIDRVPQADGYIVSNALLDGRSGRPLRKRSTAMVREYRAKFPDAFIIGVGGVFTSQHVQEKLDAGANAVAVCSAALLHGERVFERLQEKGTNDV